MPNLTNERTNCSNPLRIHAINEAIHPTHGIFQCSVSFDDDNQENVIKQFAIKSFAKSSKNREGDETLLKKNKLSFRREYELLASFKDSESNLAHPRIVSVIAYYDETYPEYGPMFVMELAEKSLSKLLKDKSVLTGDREGNYSFSHSVHFLKQIAEALAYLHRGICFNGEVKPIIHRDLKSCNVLLFNQGRDCKLCDFDISKPVEEAMTGGVGTAGWRAPELTKSKRRVSYTVAADCFSFGAVCLEVLFRKTPDSVGKKYSQTDYTGEDHVRFFCDSSSDRVVSLGESVFRDDPAFSHNKQQLVRLLSGLFEMNPTDRITAAEALSELKTLAPSSVPPLYGHDVAHPAVGAGEREATEPILLERPSTSSLMATSTTHSTSQGSDFVSVFFTVESCNENLGKEFDETDKKGSSR